MRYVSLLVTLLLCLSAKSQNIYFYRCDSLLDVYYEAKDYEGLIQDWRQIPPDAIPCLAQTGILPILIDNGDEMFSRQTIYHLICEYGFDVTVALDIYRVKDAWIDGAIADSLFQVWLERQGRERLENNQAVKSLRERERVIYQSYMKSDSVYRAEKYDAFQRSIDSVFEDLMAICVRQGFLPNMEVNGYGNDVSLSLFHILSVSDTRADKWCRVYPYIRSAFEKGLISNSYCFMYDRISYEWQRCQNFGTLDDKVPFCECMCGEEMSSLKEAYLIPWAYSFIQRNKQWLSVFDGD